MSYVSTGSRLGAGFGFGGSTGGSPHRNLPWNGTQFTAPHGTVATLSGISTPAMAGAVVKVQTKLKEHHHLGLYRHDGHRDGQRHLLHALQLHQPGTGIHPVLLHRLADRPVAHNERWRPVVRVKASGRSSAVV